jgi:succinoglycan biosynthesis protein ExoA
MIEEKPRITIVMPCLNEEAYIGRAVRSLLDSWAIRNGELLVVDGGSTDRTKQVVEDLIRWVSEVQAEWNPVTAGRRQAVIRLLDNPGRTAPTGMNMGISQAAGEIIVRADAHCVFPPAYVRRCVELLSDTGAANAGGVMDPHGEGGSIQAAIALALRHPLGTGGAAFRRMDFKGPAEGVFLGAFRKALFDEIGGYDIKATTNQDSELNVRIVRAGKKIYLDSDIKITYFPRKTLRKLAKQYFRYGRGRARTTLRHRRLTGWRQAAAPALLLVTAYAVVRAVLGQPMHLLVPAAYALGIVGAALFTLKPEGGEGAGADAGAGPNGLSFKTRMTVAAAWSVMHLSWGAGFLFGLVKWR